VVSQHNFYVALRLLLFFWLHLFMALMFYLPWWLVSDVGRVLILKLDMNVSCSYHMTWRRSRDIESLNTLLLCVGCFIYWS